jgi:DNA-binding response OmpR family regulator
VAILDISMPHADGLTVCREARHRGVTTPILMLTARDQIGDRVAGLDAGADDYLVKPFNLDELTARLRAIQRRGQGRASPLIRYGEIELDPAGKQVTLAGQPVELTGREFAILQGLLDSQGKVLTRERLDELLYGWDEGAESNAIEVHIHHLRKKLGKDLIRTAVSALHTDEQLERIADAMAYAVKKTG